MMAWAVFAAGAVLMTDGMTAGYDRMRIEVPIGAALLLVALAVEVLLP